MRKFLFIGMLVLLSSGFAVFAVDIDFGGLLEVEGNYVSNDVNKTSDINLATAQLDVKAKLNEKLEGLITFLYEEGEEAAENNNQISIDEGMINLSLTDKIMLSVGKMYLPFGNFETNLISDPLTLEIGEINKTAAKANIDLIENVVIEIAVYNGQEEADIKDNLIEDVNIKVSYVKDNFTLEGCYITNMVDVQEAASKLSFVSGTNSLNDKAGAYGLFAKVDVNEFNFICEYIGSAGDIKIDNIEKNLDAFNIELGYQINEKLSSGLRYGKSTLEVSSTETETTQIALGLGYELYENTMLSFEYKNNQIETGSVENDEDVGTFQLSYEF